MLESYPVRKRGLGMAIFGIGVVCAPIIGPTLGGWITDSYSWRWIFFINIPVGILSLILTEMFVMDPPYLRRGVTRVDYLGLGMLVIGIGALQLVLDRGQQEDWFETSWITQLSILSVACLAVLIIWELRIRHPILELHVFRYVNFWPGTLLIFTLGIALYGSMVLLPIFLQNLLGYSALQSGMVMSPGGVATLICMPLVGYLVGRKDSRYMIMFGLATMAVSMLMMARYNLQISFWNAAFPRIIMGIGMAFLFVPLSTVAFSFMPHEQMGNATGIFNLMRNIGGSFGIAAVTTMLARRAQFHQARLVENITPYNHGFRILSQKSIAQLMATGQTYWIAQKQTLGAAYGQLVRQAMTMAFIDASG